MIRDTIVERWNKIFRVVVVVVLAVAFVEEDEENDVAKKSRGFEMVG